jgi:hypothetical protein
VHEGIVPLLVAHAVMIEPAGHPLMPVDVDLDGEGKPRLQLDVDQPELAVDEIAVEVQALAPRGLDERVGLLPDQREGPARLQHGEDADQPLGDPVTRGDLPRHLLFAGRAAEILVGAARRMGHVEGVLFDPLRLREQERTRSGIGCRSPEEEQMPSLILIDAPQRSRSVFTRIASSSATPSTIGSGPTCSARLTPTITGTFQ